MKDGALEVRLRDDGQPLLWFLRKRARSKSEIRFHEKRKGVKICAPLGNVTSSSLQVTPGSSLDVRFPDGAETGTAEEMQAAFVRGMLDGAGRVNGSGDRTPRVEFKRRHAPFSQQFLGELLSFLGTQPKRSKKRSLTFTGPAALDVLGLLYEGFDESDLEWSPARGGPPPLCRHKHLLRYLCWCQKVAFFRSDRGRYAPLSFQKLSDDAIVPSKARISDSGYDLTLTRIKKRVGQVTLYGTGLVADVPQGWYLDVVARSSIIKTGHMLANNVGVIDRGYRGEIIVPLIKIDENAPELPLPARVAQLVPRPIAHFPIRVVESLSETHRGSGGFGSSG